MTTCRVAGGTSLKKYLRGAYRRREIFAIKDSNPRASVAELRALSERQRFAYRLIDGHLANELIAYVHPGCLRITVLRDPVDRFISQYYYAREMPPPLSARRD